MWPKITGVERGSYKLQYAVIGFPWWDDGAESEDVRFNISDNILTFNLPNIVFPFLLHYYHVFLKNNMMQVNGINFSRDYYSCYI